MFTCPYANNSFGPYSEELPDAGEVPDQARHRTASRISDMARGSRVFLVGGSVPERRDGLLYNTCLVAAPDGRLVAKHRKVHLFDIDVPGQITFRESDTLSAGSSVTTFETPFGRVAVGICYDVRFAPYSHAASQELGADLLVFPGAFNTVTGPAHWELLLRARALDNQVYVAACSPARTPGASYQAWGHSTVVDPWGQVVATTGHEPATVVADLSVGRLREARDRIPVRKQFRTDVYSLPARTFRRSSTASGALLRRLVLRRL